MERKEIEPKELVDVFKRAAVTFPMELINDHTLDNDFWLKLAEKERDNKLNNLDYPHIPSTKILEKLPSGYYKLLPTDVIGAFDPLTIAEWNIARGYVVTKNHKDEEFIRNNYSSSIIARSEFQMVSRVLETYLFNNDILDVIDDTSKDINILFFKFKNKDDKLWNKIREEIDKVNILPSSYSVSDTNKFFTVLYNDFWRDYIKRLRSEKEDDKIIDEIVDEYFPDIEKLSTDIDIERLITLNNFVTSIRHSDLLQIFYAFSQKNDIIQLRIVPRNEKPIDVLYNELNDTLINREGKEEAVLEKIPGLLYVRFKRNKFWDRIIKLVVNADIEKIFNEEPYGYDTFKLLKVLKDDGIVLEDEYSDNSINVLLKIKQKLLDYSEGEEDMEEEKKVNPSEEVVEKDLFEGPIVEGFNDVDEGNKVKGIRFEVDVEKLKENADKIIPLYLEKPDLLLPARATDGSAGYDLVYPFRKPITIWDKEYVLIESFIKVYMPKGYACKMYLRSSMGTKRKLRLSNQTGLVDSDYTMDTIKIPLSNYSGSAVEILPDEEIVQVVFVRVFYAENDKVKRHKRVGGLGSTGRFRS